LIRSLLCSCLTCLTLACCSFLVLPSVLHLRTALATQAQCVPNPCGHLGEVLCRAEAPPVLFPTSLHLRAALSLRHQHVHHFHGPIFDIS
ncbi:hypothetical protein EDB89DRAFT_1930200, partial [Lactarius sanguifluus]